MESPLHLGLVIMTCSEPGYAWVWIPSANSSVPIGFSQYLYENTGGQLYGNEYDKALQTSYKCKIATPLTAGSWWRADKSQNASIFDDYSDKAQQYTLAWNYQTRGNGGMPTSYSLPSDSTKRGIVALNTLSLVGGNPIQQTGTLPKGIFPILEENQWVLVSFVNSLSEPIIINTVHPDEAWKVIQQTGN